ncbi:MAG: GNAT family N-acetyltransferase [Ferruginibacter sp.]
MISFHLAATDWDYAEAAQLFHEYAVSIKINLDFQHFAEELKALKKMYGIPWGGIILVKAQSVFIGCVAIRKIDEGTCELKRMYIKPGYQKMGIGKSVLNKALQLAKECNYSKVKLDTLSEMASAIHLYKQAGFYEIPPYYNNPLTTAVYFEKVL